MAGLAHAAPLRYRGKPSLDQLLQRARADLIGNPRQALSAANAAVALADRGGDPLNRAAARQVRGDAQRFLGQHESALADYSSAGDLFRRLGQPAEASAVDSLRCLGRGPEALRLAQRTRRVLRRLGGEQLRSAVLDEIVGLVHFQQNDYARALRLFDRARPTIAAIGRPIDLAALNNNAATALTNLDRLREAETLYSAARAVYAEQGTDAALARVDVNLGNLALRQGRYGAAVDLLGGAADVFDCLRNIPLAIATRLDLVETYLALNLLDEAGILSQQQLRLAEEVGLQREHARALFYLSTQRGRLGWFDDALDGLLRAEREFADVGNLVWRTRCALARAILLLARDQPEGIKEAAALIRHAARVFARLGLSSRQALAQALLARAYLRAGRKSAAEEQARGAVWLAQGIGVPWLLFECQYLLGRALRARADSAAAYVAYREAADALERVRSELQPEELRISLVSDKADVYQELVLVCLDRSAVEEALQTRGVHTVRDGEADAVVVGWHRDFDYDGLTRAARAVMNGAQLIGTNDDATYPTPGGPIPGGGAILAAVATAAGVDPTIAGKPNAPIVELVRIRLGGQVDGSTVVGDRPSTDGRLAAALGVRFALVLSGVTKEGDLPVDPQPAEVAADLASLVR